MKGTTAYLHFNGNCRTAMASYRECFGGELEVMAYPDTSGKPNTDPKAPVMHSKLAQRGQVLLMANDSPPGSDGSTQGISVWIDCSSNGELEKLFTALSKRGKVNMPPSDIPSGRFGMCDDSFGIGWILHCAKAE